MTACALVEKPHLNGVSNANSQVSTCCSTFLDICNCIGEGVVVEAPWPAALWHLAVLRAFRAPCCSSTMQVLLSCSWLSDPGCHTMEQLAEWERLLEGDC